MQSAKQKESIRKPDLMEKGHQIAPIQRQVTSLQPPSVREAIGRGNNNGDRTKPVKWLHSNLLPIRFSTKTLQNVLAPEDAPLARG